MTGQKESFLVWIRGALATLEMFLVTADSLKYSGDSGDRSADAKTHQAITSSSSEKNNCDDMTIWKQWWKQCDEHEKQCEKKYEAIWWATRRL